MLCRRILLLLLFLVIGCGTTSIDQSSEHTTRWQILKSIVRIRVPINEGSGSGIVIYSDIVEPQSGTIASVSTISTTFILTAYHVVTKHDIVLVDQFIYDTPLKTTNKITKFGVIVAKDLIKDLALIRVNNWHVDNVARFINQQDIKQMSIFDNVYTVGCPLGFESIMTEGRLSKYDDESGRVTAQSIMGNSGGGVFLANGLCIGMSDSIAAIKLDRQVCFIPHLAMFVPATTIVNWLRTSPWPFLARRPGTKLY